MSNELDGCLGPIIGWLLIIGLIIFFVIYIVVPFLITVACIGGMYGGVISIGNYSKSFINNVIKR